MIAGFFAHVTLTHFAGLPSPALSLSLSLVYLEQELRAKGHNLPKLGASEGREQGTQ